MTSVTTRQQNEEWCAVANVRIQYASIIYCYIEQNAAAVICHCAAAVIVTDNMNCLLQIHEM